MIRTFCMSIAAYVIYTPSLTAIASAQKVPTSAGTPVAATGTDTPIVAEEVDRLLRQMAAYIDSADQLTFANIAFDHVLLSEQKLQFAASGDIALQRPDRLYVE